MIVKLSLQDPDIVEQLWSLQHTAYRLEAETVGLKDCPPLPDTFDSIRRSRDEFFGSLSEERELLGAIAVVSEIPGTLDITRLMVHSDHLRQGIGGSLLRYVLQNYEGTRTFNVIASTLNPPAVSLYRGYGFVPIKTLPSAAGIELTLFRLEQDH
ncbi:GNAT family N-acetyltransferase [Paenibacillus puldeungensis]|uniref:GNAT family N-acetyltransferase n=1 Tax=Paenibacillus puldeungensis TaxID=696536 RepID=A0ABW3S5A4_9BACL